MGILTLNICHTPKKFQYYVSTEITMNRVSETRASTIEGGQLRRRERTARDKIVIKSNLPGLVRGSQPNSNFVNTHYLKVAFENYDGDPFLWFTQSQGGNNQKHYMCYADPKNGIVTYGNVNYKISYKGTEQPYLLIKMKKSATKSAKARRVKGLKL